MPIHVARLVVLVGAGLVLMQCTPTPAAVDCSLIARDVHAILTHLPGGMEATHLRDRFAPSDDTLSRDQACASVLTDIAIVHELELLASRTYSMCNAYFGLRKPLSPDAPPVQSKMPDECTFMAKPMVFVQISVPSGWQDNKRQYSVFLGRAAAQTVAMASVGADGTVVFHIVSDWAA